MNTTPHESNTMLFPSFLFEMNQFMIQIKYYNFNNIHIYISSHHSPPAWDGRQINLITKPPYLIVPNSY